MFLTCRAFTQARSEGDLVPLSVRPPATLQERAENAAHMRGQLQGGTQRVLVDELGAECVQVKNDVSRK